MTSGWKLLKDSQIKKKVYGEHCFTRTQTITVGFKVNVCMIQISLHNWSRSLRTVINKTFECQSRKNLKLKEKDYIP